MTVQVRPYEPSDAAKCFDIINDAIGTMDGLNHPAWAHVGAGNVPDHLGRDQTLYHAGG